MSGLNVIFEIPAHLEAGLYTGVLERVGGVVRDRATKQVVAWLREGAQAGGLGFNPVNLVLHLAQAGVTLWDGHKTRQAVEVVSRQVVALTQLTATGQVVNLAMAGFSLTQMNKRLTLLSQQINQLEKTILAEFNRDRMRRFETALEAARDAFESHNANQRDIAARKAIDDLFEARQNFLEDLNTTLSKDTQNRERLKLAEQLLLNALYAHMSRIRCYWTMGDKNIAVRRLSEDMPMFRQQVERLVRAHLQPAPVRYFEKSVASEDLAHFMTIQQWLKGETGPMSAQTMFTIIDEMRQQFWNMNVFGNALERSVPFGKKRNPMRDDLHACTILIENYQRLEGFELEIRSTRLSLEEWEQAVDEESLAHYGGALIVDEDALEQIGNKIAGM